MLNVYLQNFHRPGGAGAPTAPPCYAYREEREEKERGKEMVRSDSNFINRMLYTDILTVSFYFHNLPFCLLSNFSDTIVYLYLLLRNNEYYIKFNTCLRYVKQLIKYCYCYCYC